MLNDYRVTPDLDTQLKIIEAEKNNVAVLKVKADMWEQAGTEIRTTADDFQLATNRAEAAYGGPDGDKFVADSRKSHGTMIPWATAINGSGAPVAMRDVAGAIEPTLTHVAECKRLKDEAIQALERLSRGPRAANNPAYVELPSADGNGTYKAFTPDQIERHYRTEAGKSMNVLAGLYEVAAAAVEKADAKTPWVGPNGQGGPPGGPTGPGPRSAPPGGGPSPAVPGAEDAGAPPGGETGGAPPGGETGGAPPGGAAPGGETGGAPPGGAAGGAPPGGEGGGGGVTMPPLSDMPELSGGGLTTPTIPPPGSTLMPNLPPVGGGSVPNLGTAIPPIGLGGFGGGGGGFGGGGVGGGVGGVGGGGAGGVARPAAAGPVVSPNNVAPARTAPVVPPMGTGVAGGGGGTGGAPPMMPPPMGGHGMGAGGQNGGPPGPGAARIPTTNRGKRRDEGTPGLPAMLAGRSDAPASAGFPAAAAEVEEPVVRDIVDEDLWQVAESTTAEEPRRMYR
ncbi:hypothetical protein [Actinophytocola algeriensis]|uniref:PPE family protein n=1 Tax=Actinophytocola algeriensis TaxID=1768010 RepID=A0A7W7VDP2_9PSEU|nr:hypothetical protein [Actinophytocola algeriensis]MBB4906418.1 hypothetical protein [Actinophytocola algeriensis]MBE1477899.1 hypothetical protein [Actinophytocola algeriensis]